jgi:multiple sugar transport system substrate-binding protein
MQSLISRKEETAMKKGFGFLALFTGVVTVLFLGSIAFSQPVTITYSDWHFAEKAWGASLRESVKVFEDTHPNIKVRIEPVSLAERNAKYVTSIEAGVGPDVYHVDDNSLALFIEKGYAYDVTPLINKEGKTFKDIFFDTSWNLLKRGQSYYGLPNNIAAMVLLYNQQMFKEAGLDLDKPPKTWEEFRDYAKKLTRDTHKDGKIDQWGAGFVFGKASFHLRFSSILFSLGGRYLSEDNKKSLMNSPEVVNAVQLLSDMQNKDKVFPPGIINAGAHDVRILMANRKIAMIVESIWTPSILNSINPDFKAFETIRMAPLPGKPVTCAFASCWLMNKNTKNPAAAWELMKYMSSKERLQKDWDDSTMLPARKDVAREYQPLVTDKFAKVVVSQIPNAIFVPQINEWPEIEDIFRAGVQSALTQEMSVKEALNRVNKQVQEILDKKYR